MGTPSTSEIIFARTVCDGGAPQTTTSYTIINDDARLEANKTVAMYNPSGGIADYAIPGNEVVYTIAVENTGLIAVDSNSIFLTDRLPPEVEFYNGTGGGVGAVTFSTTAPGLSFNAATDLTFSDQTAQPVDVSDCSYSASTGHDANIKHVCFSPQGVLPPGDPNPSFSVQFRTRVK
ncbi:hypothetical protein [Fretibacter rubidus]|uniref:hypothetical protein n=1 Tax=Fretibacter rubidus TaxID=570162 RepID=UPI00352B46A1